MKCPSVKCPHCGQVLTLNIDIAIGTPEAPAPKPEPKGYLPIAELDDALIEHNEDLELAQGDGVLLYAPKEYFKDKQKWISINKIIKAHGGRWISCGEGSHWEVPT